jgi:glycosyltransferase involved in cell wall biosynthesis
VVDGETGFRVDGNCVAAVSTALLAVLNNTNLAAHMASTGLARAQTEFSWDSVAEKTHLLL